MAVPLGGILSVRLTIMPPRYVALLQHAAYAWLYIVVACYMANKQMSIANAAALLQLY